MPLYLINPEILQADGPFTSASELGEAAESTDSDGSIVLNVDENGNVVSLDGIDEFLENNVDD